MNSVSDGTAWSTVFFDRKIDVEDVQQDLEEKVWVTYGRLETLLGTTEAKVAKENNWYQTRMHPTKKVMEFHYYEEKEIDSSSTRTTQSASTKAESKTAGAALLNVLPDTKRRRPALLNGMLALPAPAPPVVETEETKAELAKKAAASAIQKALGTCTNKLQAVLNEITKAKHKLASDDDATAILTKLDCGHKEMTAVQEQCMQLTAMFEKDTSEQANLKKTKVMKEAEAALTTWRPVVKKAMSLAAHAKASP